MFHLDLTFEDTRIVASSRDGHTYDCVFNDNMSGKRAIEVVSAKQLSLIVQMNLHPDGNTEPTSVEEAYAILEPLMKLLPRECRCIP